MSSRVAVVTGGNKGIGLAIVQSLCTQFQGDVYLTARDAGRGEAAVESLASQGLKPLFHQLDINDLNSITAAAAYFKEKYGGVDVLVNNAGIAFKVADTAPFAVQAEVTLKTNFFATRDMLTHFLPIIRPGGRVVNVSSFVGSRTLNQCSPTLQQRFRSDDITEEELVGLMQQFVDKAKAGEHQQAGWPGTAYGVSKTGLTALSMILARRLSKQRPNDGILLNAGCPGWVRTDMAGPKATKSPEEGAVTPVYLALLPPGATEPHGKFVSDKEVQPCFSSFVGSRTLNQCSPTLQQRFRSDDITEEELVGLMQQFVDKAKAGEHQQAGWPGTAYGVSKTGLTTLSMILARQLSKQRPNDGILLNAGCPGWVRTDMAGSDAHRSPEEGAVTPVYLALLPAGATEPHGKFVSDKEVQPW